MKKENRQRVEQLKQELRHLDHLSVNCIEIVPPIFEIEFNPKEAYTIEDYAQMAKELGFDHQKTHILPEGYDRIRLLFRQ